MEIWDSKTPLWIFSHENCFPRFGEGYSNLFSFKFTFEPRKVKKTSFQNFIENARYHNLTLQKSYCAIFMSFIFVLFRRLCISKRQEEKYGSSN